MENQEKSEMKIVRMAAIGFIIFTVLFLGISLLLPSKWKVERSTVVNTPPEKIYPYVADFKNGWLKWSAFDLQDPTIQYQYTGPESGAGAARSWTSKKMGDGSQLITKADPSKGIQFTLMMLSGDFQLVGVIAFVPLGATTKVTWTDSGEVGMNPLTRYMMLFMDSMMGPAFEQSLAKLKELAESKF